MFAVHTPREVTSAPGAQVDRIATLVDDLLTQDDTPARVAQFYDRRLKFAASTFLDLQPNEPFTLTPADLLAITLMNVALPPAGVRTLLAPGELHLAVCAGLARLPIGLPLWEADNTALAWANELWHLLVDQCPGAGPTVAGKILARKRPELIPVVDDVVTRALQCEAGTYWSTFQRVLGNGDRRRRIAQLQPGQPVLRVLDTLLWMTYRGA